MSSFYTNNPNYTRLTVYLPIDKALSAKTLAKNAGIAYATFVRMALQIGLAAIQQDNITAAGQLLGTMRQSIQDAPRSIITTPKPPPQPDNE